MITSLAILNVFNPFNPWGMENVALLEEWPLVTGILDTIIQSLISEILASLEG